MGCLHAINLKLNSMEDYMNSKVTGIMLILGPLLIVLPWIELCIDTSGMSHSGALTAILADTTSSEAFV